MTVRRKGCEAKEGHEFESRVMVAGRTHCSSQETYLRILIYHYAHTLVLDTYDTYVHSALTEEIT